MSPDDRFMEVRRKYDHPDIPVSKAGNYVPAVEANGFLFLAGEGPRRGTELIHNGKSAASLEGPGVLKKLELAEYPRSTTDKVFESGTTQQWCAHDLILQALTQRANRIDGRSINQNSGRPYT